MLLQSILTFTKLRPSGILQLYTWESLPSLQSITYGVIMAWRCIYVKTSGGEDTFTFQLCSLMCRLPNGKYCGWKHLSLRITATNTNRIFPPISWIRCWLIPFLFKPVVRWDLLCRVCPLKFTVHTTAIQWPPKKWNSQCTLARNYN